MVTLNTCNEARDAYLTSHGVTLGECVPSPAYCMRFDDQPAAGDECYETKKMCDKARRDRLPQGQRPGDCHLVEIVE